jgi:hypothetical protein
VDISKIKLLLNTVKHLRPIQVYYRFYYFCRNRLFSIDLDGKFLPPFTLINWESKVKSSLSYAHKEKSFSFLNITHQFSEQIDWNYGEHGKLWTYNLNYFDFLSQREIAGEIGIDLIHDYIKNDNILKDGKEPYPISLRGMNWIKFLSENKIRDTRIDIALNNHYRILFRNLEYHLLGNHLLENAFSLLFGSYYFQDEKLYRKAKKLLISELKEQILSDGAHFERSPMYHQIIFFRLLDSIQLIKLNPIWKKSELLPFLEGKASIMHSWLQNVTYNNGEIPMVNDSTYHASSTSKQLFAYSKRLGIKSKIVPLSTSGYRKINSNKYELFIDVGNIGPDYQPGHAHSDTFNFELIKKGNPVFVDTGISTYEKNDIRQNERATCSHNTVQIDNFEQTQVWGGFRVANRAKVSNIRGGKHHIEAVHNGYKKIGFLHKRAFLWDENKIILEDEISNSTNNKSKAFFHLHSSIKKPLIKENKIILHDLEILIEFKNFTNIVIEDYQLSEGFNRTISAYKIIVIFDRELTTTIGI